MIVDVSNAAVVGMDMMCGVGSIDCWLMRWFGCMQCSRSLLLGGSGSKRSGAPPKKYPYWKFGMISDVMVKLNFFLCPSPVPFPSIFTLHIHRRDADDDDATAAADDDDDDESQGEVRRPLP